MKKTLLKNLLFFAFVTVISSQVNAQLVYSFDTDVQGWTGGGNASGAWGSVIAYEAGSGANTGLVVIAPIEDTDTPNPGNTLTVNTIMYGPNNGAGGIDIDTPGYNAIKITLKNDTNATSLKLRCKLEGASSWTENVFTITPNDAAYKTYIFGLNTANFSGTASDISIAFNDTSGAWDSNKKISIDNLQFYKLATTYNGFVQNPSFDDVPGSISPFSPATQSYATVAVSQDFAHTGDFSVKHTYSAATTGTHFVFNNYIHDFGADSNNDVNASLWVKVVRPGSGGVSPLITVQGQIRMGPSTATTVQNLSNTVVSNKTTTVADESWQELTFTGSFATAYAKGQFRYGIVGTNLLPGDIVYVDDLSASNALLGVADYQQLKGVSINPNPAVDQLFITCPEGSSVAVYNLMGVKVKSVDNVSKSYQLPVSDLSTGLYIVKVVQDGQFYSKKIQIK